MVINCFRIGKIERELCGATVINVLLGFSVLSTTLVSSALCVLPCFHELLHLFARPPAVTMILDNGIVSCCAG